MLQQKVKVMMIVSGVQNWISQATEWPLYDFYLLQMEKTFRGHVHGIMDFKAQVGGTLKTL
jgi:hypothetical protein